MSVVGKWKVNSLGKFNEEDKFQYYTVEEYLNFPYDADMDEDEIAHEKRERDNFAGMLMEFMENGVVRTLYPIPEGVSQEDIDAAVAAGEIKIDGDYMYDEESNWKEEDGIAYIKAGRETVDGVTKDHYEPLKIDEDGLLHFLTSRFERV